MCDEWKVIPSQLATKSASPIQEYLGKIKAIQSTQNAQNGTPNIDLSSAHLCNTSEEIKDCLVETLKEGQHNGYAPSVGYEATRQAVLTYLNLPNLTPKDVVLSSGSASCLDIAITALADRGQSILIPKVHNPLYKVLAHGIGIETIEYNLTSNWDIDLIDLGRKISSNTAALLINSPHNPTGAIYCENHMRDILDLAHRHRLPVIVDESYRDCVFPGTEFISAIDVNNGMTSKVPMLVCGGIGKSFMVPGWRVGWILIHDTINAFEDVRKAVVSLSQRIIGCNTFIQGAICNIVNINMEFRSHYMQDVQNNAKYLFETLNNQYGITITPGKSIYTFININREFYRDIQSTQEFCLKLYEEQGITILPGEVFGMEGFCRIALDAKKEIFEIATKRILLFCHEHYIL